MYGGVNTVIVVVDDDGTMIEERCLAGAAGADDRYHDDTMAN